MRSLIFILLFLLTYFEVYLFIKVASVIGIFLTLIFVLLTSALGVSLVRSEGIKTLIQMREKLVVGKNPAAEVIKSVSLILAGFLLLIPGFFTDFLGLVLLLPPIQYFLTVKFLPYLQNYRSPPRSNTFNDTDQNKEKEPFTLTPPNHNDTPANQEQSDSENKNEKK